VRRDAALVGPSIVQPIVHEVLAAPGQPPNSAVRTCHGGEGPGCWRTRLLMWFSKEAIPAPSRRVAVGHHDDASERVRSNGAWLDAGRTGPQASIMLFTHNDTA
jgi:hypothetical protein